MVKHVQLYICAFICLLGTLDVLHTSYKKSLASIFMYCTVCTMYTVSTRTVVCCRSSLFQWELSLYNLFCFVNYCTILYVNYSTYINCSLFKQSSNSGTPHCPKNNLNLCLKTEPVTVGADATLHMWLVSGPDILYTVQYVTKWRTSTVAFAPAVTGSVFMRDLN